VTLIVDTNVLLRAIVADDPAQSQIAIEALEHAEGIAIGTHVLCELVWVLSTRYAVSRLEIADILRRLANTENILLDRPALAAGLAVLDAGGDFADGAIAYQGRWLGGDVFVSFDKKAVSLLSAQGYEARLL